MPVEFHLAVFINRIDQSDAVLFGDAVPDCLQAEFGNCAFVHTSLTNLAADLVEHLVDVTLEHRELLLNLCGVLVIEVNDVLHAGGAAVDAVSTLGALLDIQVVVESLVELIQDQVKTVLTQDTCARSLGIAEAAVSERAENEIDNLGNIGHSAVSVALQIDGL